MLIYSAIPYKTAVVSAGFLHGMILLAGVGAVTIVRVVASILAAVISWRGFYLCRRGIWRIRRGGSITILRGSAFNPYLYSTPVGDFMRLVIRFESS